METTVEGFFQTIREAYQASPLEIVAFILILGVLIGGLVGFFVYFTRSERRKHVELATRLYTEKADELKLAPGERELLKRMSAHLKDPANTYQLLTDEITFNAAAAALREASPDVPASSIASLRLKLGYKANRPDRAPRSSASIPEDATVLIARSRSRKPIKAKVAEPSSRAFRVTLPADARLPSGSSVEVFFQNSAGVFTFSSTVLAAGDGVAQLAHSESIRKYQKRRYFRRQIELPVYVSDFEKPEQQHLAQFREIGGGGASLSNPQNAFSDGQLIELSFELADQPVTVVARVIRRSEGGAVLHVGFEHINEGLRDRIYRAIFRPPKDEEEDA